ncbi:MAG: nicotinate phosphoribosyltransferase [Deltaproteobacteria bacterium]|nr:MAG: nicotinate phosphoribosyltransferase [Deltaproteobacteria bacterium]
MGLAARYAPSLALFTDLYELTMAHAYLQAGLGSRRGAFQLFFRSCPFGGAFALAAGLADALDYLATLRFETADLDYLADQRDTEGQPLFPEDFLHYLEGLRPDLDVDAVPEGTVVFPHEPLLRVEGPLPVAQLVESALLNLVNFQTLIATKAARVKEAAAGAPVLEFGLRRSQGPDGALSVARASFIGGCDATSDVLGGRLFGVPVKGTHAHSWVMAFDREEEAFDAWAEAQPGNCIFLVDTYDTLRGVEHAIAAARRLRERGHEMVGIRLDSGDLDSLARAAREMLDRAGFEGAKIFASGDLDEYRIARLTRAGAPIDVYGVGTRLSTAFDEPALGGVYKLVAIETEAGQWSPRLKRSSSEEKATYPGRQAVLRIRDRSGRIVRDVLHRAGRAPTRYVDPADPACVHPIEAGLPTEPLLVPAMRRGQVVMDPVDLPSIRARARAQLDALPEAVRRLEKPETYPVSVEAELFQLRRRLLEEAAHHA